MAIDPTDVPVYLWPDKSLASVKRPESIDAAGLVTNITTPCLVPFLAPVGQGDGTAILVCPGGGYHLLDWQSHVVRLAARFNPLGIAVLGLRYRTTPPSDRVPEDALDDLRRAIDLVGVHATRWRIRTDRLIGLGYSAGANMVLRHLASAEASRLYGVVMLCLWPQDRPANEYPIHSPAPRTLLCVSEADPVAPVDFSRSIDAALCQAGCDSTLSIFATGGHLAFNFRPDGTPEVDWAPAFIDWLANR